MKKILIFIILSFSLFFSFAVDYRFPVNYLFTYKLDTYQHEILDIFSVEKITNDKYTFNDDNSISFNDNSFDVVEFGSQCFLFKYIPYETLKDITFTEYKLFFDEYKKLQKIDLSFQSVDFFTADELKNVITKFFNVSPLDYYISLNNDFISLEYNYVDKDNENIKIKINYSYKGLENIFTISMYKE